MGSFINLTAEGCLIIQQYDTPVDLREAARGKTFERLHVYGRPSSLDHISELTHLVELKLQSTGHLDFACLKDYTRLQELNCFSGSLRAIDLAFAKKTLKKLSIGRHKALIDVSPIAVCSRLEVLELSHLPNIERHVSLSAFSRLKELQLINLRTWPGVEGLAKTPRLETLSLGRTKIADGDWSPLLRLKRLNFVGGLRDAFGPAAAAEFRKKRPDVEAVD